MLERAWPVSAQNLLPAAQVLPEAKQKHVAKVSLSVAGWFLDTWFSVYMKRKVVWFLHYHTVLATKKKIFSPQLFKLLNLNGITSGLWFFLLWTFREWLWLVFTTKSERKCLWHTLVCRGTGNSSHFSSCFGLCCLPSQQI